MNTTARQIALLSLCRCESDGKYSNLENDAAIKKFALEGAEKKLYSKLLYGTIEKKITLDHIISQISSKKLEDMSLQMLNILRMAIYQLRYLDRIPDHAAVNETVDLATKRTKGFVNAVLRAFLRNGKQISYPDAGKDPVGYLSARYSFLPALCERFLAEFGFDRTEALFSAFCKQPPLTLRANTLKVGRDELILRLQAAGFDASPTPESAVGIHLPTAPVSTLPGFDAGDFIYGQF